MLRDASSLSEVDLRRKLNADLDKGRASQGISTASPLRKISLKKLEHEVAELNEAGKPIPSEIRLLAGLTAVKHVFFYPGAGDVVLAGPAEGWDQLPTGDVVGVQSRRPVLQLDDLVEALRYAFASKAAGSFLGCSIEPTEQGLKAHAAYVRRLANMDRTQVPQIILGMEQAIGPQDIHVYGASGSSRFALQMIAADYRLKRIALAHDPSPSKEVPSYLDLAEQTVTGGPQRQHRWWFVGHYDAIRHTTDDLAFEFEGAGLKVDTAPAGLNKPAGRNAPKPAKAATAFAELATRHLPELSEQIPAFAELQNLVGLAVAAALVHKQAGALHEENPRIEAVGDEGRRDVERPSRWRPADFLDERRCPIASYETPKQTPALANVRFVKDRFWMFSVSGGVEINPDVLIDDEQLKPAKGEKLAETRRAAVRAAQTANWWWD
jgi:hypothetical protein